MRRVIVESPFAGRTPEETAANVAYAKAAVRDCVLRGEAPIASHLLFTQPGILRDEDQSERALGMKAGLAWSEVADAHVVYVDRGISSGMRAGMARARANGKPVEERTIKGAIRQMKAEDAVPEPADLAKLLLSIGVGTPEEQLVKQLVRTCPGPEGAAAAAAFARARHEHLQGRSPTDPTPPDWLVPILAWGEPGEKKARPNP